MVHVTFPRRHTHARREVPKATGPKQNQLKAALSMLTFVCKGEDRSTRVYWLTGWLKQEGCHTHTHAHACMHLQDSTWVHLLMSGCITHGNRDFLMLKSHLAPPHSPPQASISASFRRFQARERWCGASSLPVVALWSPWSSPWWSLWWFWLCWREVDSNDHCWFRKII